MEDQKDLKVASQLFGTVKKLPCTGGHKPDSKKLKKPFEWEQAVVRSFCEGCGITIEINRKFAEDLALIAKVELPASLNKWFFSTKSCHLCDGKDKAAELKRIPL